ncbi:MULTISPECIES: DUF2339 domain-containing protein [unclassified Ensifer]|uniref:DUF2339 domain-containing protein n=1 Tax=unclassified Ensifer TaxID=2633371 RepID=UPI0008139016|nr:MULTISPECIES: DUF2339 domain-containing protein [unclassified Ensifer]OCO98177.1 hypothetical protein BC362_03610 [Ensifer sp. LC14]OCP03846.1 hypothetical protein BBX50_26595 [Ensifer sp. LC11]OCP04207.1 hypothetical protein BC374_26610 [Ensifer sp. LC13]OCP30349.1 hypothetical protein BC364_26615 [Ensifer sp. LC499]
MFEIFAFVAFILALSAFLGGRRTAERLAAEIAALKAEIARLNTSTSEGLGPEAATENVAPTALPVEAEMADEGVIATSDGAREGARIFSDATASEEESHADVLTTETVPVSAMPTRSAESLESKLGARWAVWVGGVALALGGVFMVKYSIDAGLLSPAVRLTLAALFGLLLAAAGEVIRRRAVPVIANEFQNAMIPGILTAAGAVTLFGVAYAAHGIYGYIGTVTTFVLLAVISLSTVGLSLLHGQALAGLGLLASMITPALVASDEPRPWVLFGFLSVVWLATLLASRRRSWTVVPTLANAGIGLWGLAYVTAVSPFEPQPVAFALLVVIAGVGLIWPGGVERVPVVEPSDGNEQPGAAADPWDRLFKPPHTPISVSAAITAAVLALLFISPVVEAIRYPVAEFVIVIAALAVFGALRTTAVYPALVSGIGAIAGVWNLTTLSGVLTYFDPSLADIASAIVVPGRTAMVTAMLLATMFVLLGGLVLRRRLDTHPQYAILWAFMAAVVPVALTAMSFLMTGNYAFDLPHGLFALVVGVALLALADWLYRADETAGDGDLAASLLVLGSFALFILTVHAWTDGLVSTLAIAVLGTAYAVATRIRTWPILPWMTGAAAIVVLGRIGWEPTIVGAGNLGTTPVFNALLPGYGIPAALLVASAYYLRSWPDTRVRNLLQALASLFVLLTVAILVRHAMNGGVLDSSVPTLGEQSTYTLLAIGASAIFMSLDLKSPSPVFLYGGMGIGVLSMLSVLSAHLFGLNPYFSGELLGRIPFFDLLLIGYLLPGLGYAGLAWYARNRRPMPYVTALAVSGAVLAFVWASLSVRRAWQGENIAAWKGFLQGETYTYSVVWLLLGVLLLVLGSRFQAKSIRIASAILVFVAVLKVFLIDMSNLEGFLRALSFIGLGGVLIGIGLFYQKILSGMGTAQRTPATPAEQP